MKNPKRKMRIFFLGTNGWFATRTGSTVCAAIAFQDRLIVLDAGDGFQHIPALLLRLRLKRADVFLSHLHIDHVAGLHLLPLLPRGTRVRIFAHKSCIPALKQFVAHPYTAPPSEQWAKVTLHPLSTGKNKVPIAASGKPSRPSARHQAYSVLALPLHHADPCFGYRFSLEGKEIAYCTDTGPCRNYTRLAAGADLLITECSLLPGALPTPSWPHLSPQTAANEAKKAGAARLILTHFDANKYSSLALRYRAQKAARKIFPRTSAARDGMEIEMQ
ncbi:MAG: MBL fold metallo-hydrolase [Candidatus Micrarchaeota archaeon]|nr:MBL fold metallo-hydrolase [Candidatus Micrarchaeota archaeon]